MSTTFERNQQAPGLDVMRMGYAARTQAQLMDTLDVLRSYFEDPDINEIMINGPDDVFITRLGEDTQLRVKLSASHIRAAIHLLAGMVDKEVGEKSNRRMLRARLPGFRVNAILPPVAINGPTMCIRRHASRVFTMDEYVAGGTISPQYAKIMQDAIEGRENFLVVGGTGSGKTTLMNTVLTLIPKKERLVVIETVHELQIKAPNAVIIECDDEQGVTPRQAVNTAMQYAPKRIIVGELKGPEAYDWMDAANTGHPGSGATIHANSARRALGRLENLLLMANMGVPHEPLRVAIAESVQWLFYMKREGPVRTVSEICRVNGYDRKTGEYEVENF
jgi:pilus assembly protein CpaF